MREWPLHSAWKYSAHWGSNFFRIFETFCSKGSFHFTEIFVNELTNSSLQLYFTENLLIFVFSQRKGLHGPWAIGDWRNWRVSARDFDELVYEYELQYRGLALPQLTFRLGVAQSCIFVLRNKFLQCSVQIFSCFICFDWWFWQVLVE